jgi:hypothetical protein
MRIANRHFAATLPPVRISGTDGTGNWVDPIFDVDYLKKNILRSTGIRTPDHPVRNLVPIPNTLSGH